MNSVCSVSEEIEFRPCRYLQKMEGPREKKVEKTGQPFSQPARGRPGGRPPKKASAPNIGPGDGRRTGARAARAAGRHLVHACLPAGCSARRRPQLLRAVRLARAAARLIRRAGARIPPERGVRAAARRALAARRGDLVGAVRLPVRR